MKADGQLAGFATGAGMESYLALSRAPEPEAAERGA